MKKKYGGVNNSKAYDEVQEASVVGEPKPAPKPVVKRSTASIIGEWVVYIFVTYLIMELLIVATGVYEWLTSKNAFVAIFCIPFIPTIIRATKAIYKSKKRTT